jgi:hypothetical protein
LTAAPAKINRARDSTRHSLCRLADHEFVSRAA